MNRRFALTLAFTLAATASMAAPFDGQWAYDRGICGNRPDQTDVVPLVIEGSTITGYESSCDITTIEPIGSAGAAWRARLSCGGEGETWAVDALFALLTDLDGKVTTLVEIDMEAGHVVSYFRCD